MKEKFISWEELNTSLPVLYFIEQQKCPKKFFLFRYTKDNNLLERIQIIKNVVVKRDISKVNNFSDIKEKFKRYSKVFITSNHLYEIGEFALKNGMYTPFNIDEFRAYLKSSLIKRYEDSFYQRLNFVSEYMLLGKLKPTWTGEDRSIPEYYFTTLNKITGELYLYKYQINSKLLQKIETKGFSILRKKFKTIELNQLIDQFPIEEDIILYHTSEHCFNFVEQLLGEYSCLPFHTKNIKSFMREDLRDMFGSEVYYEQVKLKDETKVAWS